MGRKRPERTERRKAERAARQLVRDRERLALLVAGGSRERPIEVPSASVVDTRALAQACPQCGGRYRIDDHQAESAVLRVLSVTCQRCGVARRMWLEITTSAPN